MQVLGPHDRMHEPSRHLRDVRDAPAAKEAGPLRYRADSAQLRHSRPDSGLGWSRDPYESLDNHLSCPLAARQLNPEP
jgi:hypothetical protein